MGRDHRPRRQSSGPSVPGFFSAMEDGRQRELEPPGKKLRKLSLDKRPADSRILAEIQKSKYCDLDFQSLSLIFLFSEI